MKKREEIRPELHHHLLHALLRQYLYFCTSKASKALTSSSGAKPNSSAVAFSFVPVKQVNQ
jgi:hypothetical protein